jgi:hypothetical protein
MFVFGLIQQEPSRFLELLVSVMNERIKFVVLKECNTWQTIVFAMHKVC